MILHRLIGRRVAVVSALLFCASGLFATAVHAQSTPQLGGWVYIDRNNDGHLAFSNEANPEYVIPDVSISLFSKSGSTETLLSTILSDQFGRYLFTNLSAGTYVLRETQPIEFVDGIDTLGSLYSTNSQPIPPAASAGTVSADAFINIVLTSGVAGDAYNFGERGLKAGYASKRYLLASAPPLNTATPEPSSMLLVMTAVGGLFSWRSSRRRAIG
jgi:hypothetical protein